jgi:hypothetical protein
VSDILAPPNRVVAGPDIHRAATSVFSFLLEKLEVILLPKKFPAFYGIWRFITVFTTARHWFLS